MTDPSLKVCESWKTIKPSRKEDTLSKDTAEQIAGNNVAREVWCEKSAGFASLSTR